MKTIRANLNYLNYLFWLGPMLIIAGLTAGAISGIWAGVPLGMTIAGAVLVGLWLVVQSRRIPEAGFWGQRSTQVGANAFVTTISVVVILGLLNFLAARYGGRSDLTENQQFTLSPQTQQIVQTLKQPLRVIIFDGQQNPQDRELLDSYRRQGPRFSYEYVNATAQPGLAQAFEVKNPGDVFIEAPEKQRKRLVQPGAGPENPTQERLSEAKLTNAIESVTSDRQTQIYFVQGHSERPFEEGRGAIAQALKSLSDRNFTVKPLNLIEAEIPADAAAIVVAGPQKALLESETKAIEAYLKRGGRAMILVDAKVNAGLDSLLNGWGVTLENLVILDRSGAERKLGPADIPVTRYGNHPITKDFSNGTLSFYSFARPLDVKTLPDVRSTVLLYSSDRSWTKADLSLKNLEFNPQTDRQGPFAIGVALTRPVFQSAQPQTAPTPAPTPQASPTPPTSTPTPSPTSQTSPSPSPFVSPSASPTPQVSPSSQASPSPSPTTSPTSGSPTSGQPPTESRLVVIGNSNFATDGLFDQVINGDVFLNSVRWLSQGGLGQDTPQTLSIRPKETKNRRILLTTQQGMIASWTALVILPLLGFITAIGLWWRRR